MFSKTRFIRQIIYLFNEFKLYQYIGIECFNGDRPPTPFWLSSLSFPLVFNYLFTYTLHRLAVRFWKSDSLALFTRLRIPQFVSHQINLDGILVIFRLVRCKMCIYSLIRKSPDPAVIPSDFYFQFQIFAVELATQQKISNRQTENIAFSLGHGLCARFICKFIHVPVKMSCSDLCICSRL